MCKNSVSSTSCYQHGIKGVPKILPSIHSFNNSLHIHSFAYLNYGLALLIIFKLITPNMEEYEAWRGILAGLFLVITSTYAYISFLKVYKQGWFKTLIKFWLTGFIYGFFLNTFFFLELAISFWYYG